MTFSVTSVVSVFSFLNHMTSKIPESVQKIINQYKELEFSNTLKVWCPYFKNYKKISGMKLRALSGKGTPDEIITEAKINYHIAGFNWRNSSAKEIRDFMLKRDIGIDCSGFIVWLYFFWFKYEYRKNFFKEIRQYLDGGVKRWLRLIFRPSQNIDVKDLTSERVSYLITDLSTLWPGDMIRTKNGHHILVISEVMKEESEYRIAYTHSTDMYGTENGVRTGYIEILDKNKPLEEQNWTEKDMNNSEERNWTFEGYKDNQDGRNGIYRLKVLEKLKTYNS